MRWPLRSPLMKTERLLRRMESAIDENGETAAAQDAPAKKEEPAAEEAPAEEAAAEGGDAGEEKKDG